MKTGFENFSLSLQSLAPHAQKIAVAVSGGGDSLALTLLAQEWAKKNNAELLALTVDHGLREGSKAEAETLSALLSARGIPHKILRWQGEKPATHIQERAREMRYKLLLEECKKQNFPVLAVAHNAEDQMETFWMRLAHGSGLDGLAAMAPSRNVEGITIIRPLLSFPRETLREACKSFGVAWAEDPSNANEKFLRVKLRAFEDVLAGEGLTPQRLARSLQKLSDARDALQFFAQNALDALAVFYPAGYVTLKKDWSQQPADIQRRMLSHILQYAAPQDYAAGFDALEQSRLDMARQDFAGRTVAGVDIFPAKDGFVLCREAAAAAPRATVAEGLVWDNRFQVSGYPLNESLEVGLLGEEGVVSLRKSAAAEPVLLARLEALPHKLRKALPALWKGQNVVAVPHLSWIAPDTPESLRKGHLLHLGAVKIV